MEARPAHAPPERANADGPAPADPAEGKAGHRAERDVHAAAAPPAAPPAAPGPGAAAPPPAAEPAPAPPLPDAGPRVTVDAERFYAHTVHINSTFHGQPGAERAQVLFKTLPWAELDGRRPSADPAQVIAAAKILKHRRVLVLRGEPELGKATVAREVIRHAAEAPLDAILQCDDPGPAVSVPLEAWTGDASYRRRALVFKNAFARGNASLRNLGPQLSRDQLDRLTSQLRRADMFVVLTSDPDDVPAEWSGVVGELGCELGAPSLDVLRRHLDDEITRFANRSRVGPAAAIALDADQRAQLVATLRTIPRLIRFAAEYFDALASGRSTLAAALRDFDSLTRWFVERRDCEPAAWCLAFALCLLEADPVVERVPWTAVISLAAALAHHLRHSIPSWKGRQPRFVEPDEVLLVAARMELATEASDDGDHVRFVEERYGADLWRVLASSGRGLLWTIHPVMAAQAESHGAPFWLATMTALGRVCAIDGMVSIEPQLRRLVSATTPIEHVGLGRLLVGVRASERPACFERCIAWLRSQVADGAAWPFMLAMREIGLVDLARAVREMVDATRWLVGPRLSGLDALHRALGDALADHRESIGVLRETVEVTRRLDRHKQESLRALFGLIFDARIVDCLDAARFAIIGLCFGVGPVDACIAFLPYLETDPTIAVTEPDPTIGCIVAMLFFSAGRDAVFSVIDRDHVRMTAPDAGADGPAVGRVMLGLGGDPPSRVGPFARFLACAFEALSALPPAIGQPMQDHVLTCVKRWARDAVRTAATTPAMTELLCRLRRDARSPLGIAVTRLLRSDEDFRKRGSPLQALAVDVLTSDDAETGLA